MLLRKMGGKEVDEKKSIGLPSQDRQFIGNAF